MLMIMRIPLYRAVGLWALMLPTMPVFSQLSNEHVDIVKDFDARLLESYKLQVAPRLPDLDTFTKAQEYLVPAHPLNLSYDPPQLRPIGIKSTKPPEPFRGFARLGAGAPNQFWAESGYYFGSPDKMDGTISFRHHSGNNNKRRENQRFGNNDLKAKGTLYLPGNMAVSAHAGYSFDQLHYYGYDNDEFSFDQEAVRQRFNMLDLGGAFFNTESNNLDINYWIKPRFYHLKDRFANKENGIHVETGAEKWFSKKHLLRLNMLAESTSYTDTLPQKLNNLALQPSFTFHADILKVKAGLNLVSSAEGLSVLPDVEANLRLIGNGVQVFAGAQGELRQNTMRTMTAYSPWINMRGSTLKNTRYTEYYGGLKGNFGFLEYAGRAGFANARDLALFQTSFRTVDQKPAIAQFTTLYDNANIFFIRGSAQIELFRYLKINGSFSQNVYDMDAEEKPWGLPATEGNFGAVYSLIPGKASIHSNLYMANDIPFRTASGSRTSTNPLFDLNVGGHYYILEHVGLYLELNNLLNNRRERWLNYPMFGTNFIAGLRARF